MLVSVNQETMVGDLLMCKHIRGSVGILGEPKSSSGFQASFTLYRMVTPSHQSNSTNTLVRSAAQTL